MVRKPSTWATLFYAALCVGGCASLPWVQQAVQPAQTGPATTQPADVTQQQGGVNVAANDNEAALLNRVEKLESQLGVINARVGNVSYWNIGGGGVWGLVLYYVTRYLGVRPPTPAERKANGNGG